MPRSHRFSHPALGVFGLLAFSVLTLAMGCSGGTRRGQRVQADLVFLGGDLHTMDTKAPRATALAIRGQHIVAVGSDETISSLIGDTTRVISLKGHSLTPGLTDAHCHLYGLGKTLESVNLRGVGSAQEAVAVALKFSTQLKEGEWLVGRGWDQTVWDDKKFPHYSALDIAFPARPVALRRVDGHAVWINQVVLKMTGIDDTTADPPGGVIVRDSEGHATGVLIDNAMDMVPARSQTPSLTVIRRRILTAAKVALSHGITSVHEMGLSDEVIGVYRGLADEGRLPLRVYAMLGGDLKTALALKKRIAEQDVDGTEHFVLRGIKLYADGALGSRGAALIEDYSDDQGNRGNWIHSPEELKQAALAVADAGWQLAIHAIGDAANRAVLDAYAEAIAMHPKADLRFRVEHAQVLSQEDISRFSTLGVIASMQPTHATSDMRWAEKRVGAARITGAYAWRKLLDSGAHLVAGSDFPVEKVAPLLGLYSAVTRQNLEGMPKGGWLAGERLSLDEAIAIFTVEAAYAGFVEGKRGVLKAGYVADLTVFDRVLSADQGLLATEVDMTVVGGAVAFERE